MGLGQFVKSIYQGRPGNNIVYTRYPAEAVGVGLTASGVGAYKYVAAGANEVQILAAKAIATPFWVAGGGLDTVAPLASIYILKVCSGLITAGVQLFEIQVSPQVITAVGHITMATVFVPLPVRLAANVPVCADLASSSGAADTANGHIVCYV